MRKLLTFLFSLIILNSFGQTEIKERKYKISYTDNNTCLAFNYDITIPHLTVTNDKDIRNIINDSIISIAQWSFSFFPDGQSSPIFDYIEQPCEGISLIPEEVTMRYKVYKNTGQFLSITVSVDVIPSGGHGGGTTNYYFNTDILNNKLVSIDSLFDPKNKNKLIKLIKTKFDKEQNMAFESYEEQIKLDGINISDMNFIAHYSVLYPSSWQYDVTLSSMDINNLLAKKYNWLFADSKK
jgi:hypothetical protein